MVGRGEHSRYKNLPTTKQGHGHKDAHKSGDVDEPGHLCETEKAGRKADE